MSARRPKTANPPKTARPPKSRGLIAAYKKYQEDSLGWGVPGFTDFRERLWPLRTEPDRARWPDNDMLLVMQLQEEGGGRALQNLFTPGGRVNPVAAEVLGEGAIPPESMSRSDLDSHMQALVRDCKAGRWTPGEFSAFIDYLDSDMTPADLAATKPPPVTPAPPAPPAAGGAPAAEGAEKERDAFAEAYRDAGAGFRRRVIQHLAAAAAVAAP